MDLFLDLKPRIAVCYSQTKYRRFEEDVTNGIACVRHSILRSFRKRALQKPHSYNSKAKTATRCSIRSLRDSTEWRDVATQCALEQGQKPISGNKGSTNLDSDHMFIVEAQVHHPQLCSNPAVDQPLESYYV
jgi:hypothetical protein